MYFIRVNGDTSHNNPAQPHCFVPSEPPKWPTTYYDYLTQCLSGGFVRIGWPDVGDLNTKNKQGALANCYSWQSLNQHIRDYLDSFFKKPVGSIVLMPDKGNSGDLYIGTTTSNYYYYHNVPSAPYECAHRIDVNWDKNANGNFIVYKAAQFGINIHGGLWMRAFHILNDQAMIRNINNR